MKVTDCWYRQACNQAPANCNNSCLRFLEMSFLLSESNIPEDKWAPVKLAAGLDLANFKYLASLKDNIEDWVINGNNLYIYSDNFGNGKTSWAIKLMLAYFDKIWAGNGFRRRGLFVSVPAFLTRNREIIGSPDPEFVKLRDSIAECDLVIWDDIASTKLSDFDHSALLTQIDQRILAERSNIYTGNAGEDNISKYLGGRLASRVWNCSQTLKFIDSDKRGICR